MGKLLLDRRWQIAAGIALLAIVVGLIILGSQRRAASPANRAEIEAVVRDYILEHPEILPEAIERLRGKEAANAYTANKAMLETPFESAWAGAKDGDVTLVMFSDYACGYCRVSVPHVDRLIAEDPKLKVVWREVPILGPGSEIAARGALAAAVQGQFLAFHRAMFAAGRPDPIKVTQVLRTLKIDLSRVQKDANSPVVAAELQNNRNMVSLLDGSVETPTFLVNGQLLKGAVGYEALKQAIAEARARATS